MKRLQFLAHLNLSCLFKISEDSRAVVSVTHRLQRHELPSLYWVDLIKVVLLN